MVGKLCHGIVIESFRGRRYRVEVASRHFPISESIFEQTQLVADLFAVSDDVGLFVRAATLSAEHRLGWF
jgi:hypothetical protein